MSVTPDIQIADGVRGAHSLHPVVRGHGRTHLDLFSGIGGFALAAEWCGVETIGFSEINEYATNLLKRHWPTVQNFGDVRNVRNVRAWLVTGGFPCQPFSCAGNRSGKEDDRYLWPEMLRVVDEARPAWVLAENVPDLDGMALDEVLSDLESIGYETAPPLEIPAAAIGASHARRRLWLVANAKGEQSLKFGEGGEVAGTARQRQATGARLGNGAWWDATPRILGSDDGLSGWVDRNEALGNAIVPQLAAELIRMMIDAETLVSPNAKVSGVAGRQHEEAENARK